MQFRSSNSDHMSFSRRTTSKEVTTWTRILHIEEHLRETVDVLQARIGLNQALYELRHDVCRTADTSE